MTTLRLAGAGAAASAATRERLSPGVTWCGWTVPTALEIVIVLLLGAALLAVAVARFDRTE